MAGSDGLLYDIAAFLAGLFLLEYGADKFIDHTAVVAKRLNISPTLIGLLTCGAEWEELIVISFAIGQNDSELALGNLLGSSVANVLASFSLGLLFLGSASFDRSSKIYACVLLLATTVFLCFLWLLEPNAGWLAGGILLAAFVAYIASIASLIFRGTLAAPEGDSDSDSSESGDSGSDSDSEGEGGGQNDRDVGEQDNGELLRSTELTDDAMHPVQGAVHTKNGPMSDGDPEDHQDSIELSRLPSARPGGSEEESRSLFKRNGGRAKSGLASFVRRRPKPLWRHLVQLLLGLSALLISSYIVAHSASNIGAAMGLTGTTIGTTLVSLATTIPEKFVAIMSGVRRQPGIMIANTVGSNIFLATLCGGVLFLCANGDEIKQAFTAFEAGMVWASAATIFAIVVFGARRWMAICCICAYLGFVVAELVTGRSIDDD